MSKPLRSSRFSPQLKGEIRIPILKIEKLQDGPATVHCESEKIEEDVTATKPENETETTKAGKKVSGTTAASESEPSSAECTDSSSTSKDKRRKTSNSNEPRKIIQSIFAKPKKEKARRRAKAKNSLKKYMTKRSQVALRIKIAPAANKSSSTSKKETSDADDEDQTDETEVNPGCSQGSSKSSVGGGGKGINSEAEEMDDESDGKLVNSQTTDDACDDHDSISRTSRRSDDEDDFNENETEQEDDWKPVRAAMVAAMELVAKKQVTEDMRLERRVRKHNIKPLPPKGRGRRTIFKRMQKPTRSLEESVGPNVTSSIFYNHEYHQIGDIVCLLNDLEEDNPNPIRFFQVTGFLSNICSDVCASLMYLERNPEAPEQVYVTKVKEEEDEISETETPQLFAPSDYAPGPHAQEMIDMKHLKLVMHAPPDYYYGHDLTYPQPSAGRTYQRLGCPVFEYVEEPVLKIEVDVDSTKCEDCDSDSNTNSNS